MYSTETPTGYSDISAMAAELRRPMHSLIALSDDNDPFIADRPGRRLEGAQWFAELWNRLEIPDGVHLRRLHYLLVSTANIILPGGEVYQNTHKCWKFLGSCSADARYLDLVDADAFVDRRASEPVVYLPDDEAATPSITVEDGTVPEFAADDIPLMEYTPVEYDIPDLPSVALHPPKLAEAYAIEMWVEKSTAEDILLPIAQARRVGLVTGVGEMSITRCLGLVRRVLAHRRPTRILYLSDHDPAGDGMPVSVARKIEYFLRREGGDDLDVRLIPIVLTAKQVERYDLPRVPIKETERRRAAFEERHGEGAVELDALEALHPGELGRIVEEAIDVYRSPTRRAKRAIDRLAANIERDIAEVTETVVAEHEEDLAPLRSEFEDVQDAVAIEQAAIAALIQDVVAGIARHERAIEQHLDRWRAHAAPVWESIRETIEDRLPDLTEIEWPQPEPPDEAEALYDSHRDYVEQIARYKLHQGKPVGRRSNGGM